MISLQIKLSARSCRLHAIHFNHFRLRVYNLLVTSRHNKPLNHDIICFVSYLITKLLQSRTSFGGISVALMGACLRAHCSNNSNNNNNHRWFGVLPQQSHRIQTHIQQKETISRQSDDTMHGFEYEFAACWWMVAKNTTYLIWKYWRWTQLFDCMRSTHRTRSRVRIYHSGN